MKGTLPIALATIAALLVAGCQDGPTASSVRPEIAAAWVTPNQHNTISGIVYVHARAADSVAVRFRIADGAVSEAATPALRLVNDSAAIPVLGLLPESRYALQVIAYGAGANAISESLELNTGALPADLPRYTAGGSNPSPGYVVFAAGGYGVVIDNSGRVVWYRHFPNGPGLNFMAQPNGHYVARPSTPDPTDDESWLELDALGNVTAIFDCGLGLSSRFHDVILEPDGGYWIMCDETRTMNLAAVGGVSSARVTGTAVQHISARGALLFHWSSFDHLAITDLDPAERTGTNVNWIHGNALELDTDGNLLLSSRSLGEITKIDMRSGVVLWRLGGRRNQFTFVGTDGTGFARQHSVRVYAPGSLLILDNLGNPTESRAERYIIDEDARTARLVQSHGSVPAVVTQIGGSVQNLPGGNTLVSFGTAGRVEEYDLDGRVVWRINGNAGYVFRAQRIRSLYTPGAGLTR